MKILSGKRDSVRRRIFTADLWKGPIREIAMPPRDPSCPCCAGREFVHLNGRRAPVSLCGRNAVQIHELRRPLDLTALAQQLQGLGNVRSNEFALRFDAGNHEMTIFPDGRAIVKGTTDVGVARSLYAKYIGN
jgi:adenylyltransferase/sulfurtransferase